MAYVPDFEHDIFISYALVDDEKLPGVDAGWVTTFASALENRLSAAIGRLGRLRPWWDRTQLHENQPLDKQIQQALERTACLVVVLSPGFLKSPWCPLELEIFQRAVQSQCRADSRVFIVDLGTVTEQERRSAFSNYKPFDFWKVDDRRKRTLGYPAPNAKDHPEFYDSVDDLARKLKEEFDQMMAAKSVPAPSGPGRPQGLPNKENPPASTGPVIYVAEASDDVNTARKQVVTFLESHQFRVVCGGRNADDVESWKAAVTHELTDATCFVQLLGLYPGRELDGASSGLVRLQHEMAASLGKKVLQWRAPDLLAKTFEDQAHFEAVKAASAIECPLEGFKAEVKRIATPPPPPRPVDEPPVVNGFEVPPTVFIHAGVEDIEQAELLSCKLSELNCWVTTPLTRGEPDKIREDLEANLTECDGLIVYYGKISPDWVRAQFRSLPRVLPKRQRLDPPRPLRALAICSGDPNDHPNPGVNIPNMQWLDLSKDAGRVQLGQWVENLRKAAAK